MSSRTLFFLIAGAFLASVFVAKRFLRDMNETASISSPISTLDLSQYKAIGIKRVKKDTIEIQGLKDRPVMINFWASWCAPCMTEMPSIYKLHEKYRSQGFEVVAINLDVDLGKGVEALARRFGKPPFLIVPGHESEYVDIFQIEGVPYTLLLDRKGKIRYSSTGERDWMDEESIKLVEGIM